MVEKKSSTSPKLFLFSKDGTVDLYSLNGLAILSVIERVYDLLQ